MNKSQLAKLAGFVLAGLASGLLLGLVLTHFPGERSGKGEETQKAPTPSPSVDSPPGIVFSQKILALLATAEHLYVSRPHAGVSRMGKGEDWENLRLGMDDPKIVQTLVELRPTRQTLNARLMEAGAEGGPIDEETLKSAMTSLAAEKPGILAGTRDGRVLRWEKDRWRLLSRLPEEGGGVFRLRYEPAVGLAACTGRGLFFSRDGGVGWEKVTGDARTRDVLMTPLAEGRFLIARYGGGVQSCGAEGRCAAALDGFPQRTRRVVGDGTPRGAYFGSDGDGLWHYRGTGRPEQISTIALDNADIHDLISLGSRLLVAAGPAGLWMRDSPGSGWRPGRGLPPDSVNTVALFNGRVYVGTLRYGLFSASLKGETFSPVL